MTQEIRIRKAETLDSAWGESEILGELVEDRISSCPCLDASPCRKCRLKYFFVLAQPQDAGMILLAAP